MKNYKQILEAVNRGIQLALDDFDDEEQVQNIKSKQVYNRDYTKEYLDLMEEVVDLGLPSGTLWCKYNLGVDINNITSSNQLIGDYYAWGEIKPNKPKYDMESYKFGNGSGRMDELTKYVTLEKFTCNPFNDDSEILTQVDNLTQLKVQDDAAYQNKKLHNFKFHIPTKEQFEELIKYTTIENIYVYVNHGKLEFSERIKHNEYNVYGVSLTSIINGNQLFFPFGSYKDSDYNNPFMGGHYWTSNLYQNYPEDSYYMCSGYNFIKISNGKRYRGLNVRPVINI